MDRLFHVTLYGTMAAFALVEVGTLWFILKGRAESGGSPARLTANGKAEVVWTAIPAVVLILVTLGGWSR